jgi:hypothetical protein
MFLGGVLAAAGKWIWHRLSKTVRPPRSNAYMAEQLSQIMESQERIFAKVDAIEARVMHLEASRRSASAGD